MIQNTDECHHIPECPNKAIKAGAVGEIGIDRKECVNCGKCVDICPAKAVNLFGEEMSVDDVIYILEKDSLFHSRSRGGVTLSGGDPIGQAEFVYRLLKKCKGSGMNIAIETAGYGFFDALEKISRFTDLFFYDIKSLNTVKHRDYIGVANEVILENLKSISQRFADKIDLQNEIIKRTEYNF